MFRATTPTHTFTLPIDTSRLSKILITYAQNGNIVLEKTEADCTLEGCNVSLTLTQEETLLFTTEDDARISIQIRVLTADGKAYASEIEKEFARNCLNEEVLA